MEEYPIEVTSGFEDASELNNWDEYLKSKNYKTIIRKTLKEYKGKRKDVYILCREITDKERQDLEEGKLTLENGSLISSKKLQSKLAREEKKVDRICISCGKGYKGFKSVKRGFCKVCKEKAKNETLGSVSSARVKTSKKSGRE